MSQPLDAQGEAHDALGTAVNSYGQRVLNDPHILGNLVTDLLPDLPRERNLLVTGAEAGVAADMTQHVEEQHIDPDTAVQLAARTLSERRAIDPAASMWVATEYAQALGYRVRPYAEAAQAAQPQVIPAAPPTMTALSGQPMPTTPPAQAPTTDPQWQAAQTPQGAPGAEAPQGRLPGTPGRTPSSRGSPGRRPSLLPGPRQPHGTAGNSASSSAGPWPDLWSFSSSSPGSRASRRSASPPQPLLPRPLTRRFLLSRSIHPTPTPTPDREPGGRCYPPHPAAALRTSPTRRHNALQSRSPTGRAPGWSRPSPAMIPTCRTGP